jgi:hypothetical protein
VPEVPRQPNAHDARVAGTRRDDEVERPIGTAVVNEDDLVRPAAHAVQYRSQPADELGQHRFLVVDGDRDRDARLDHRATGSLDADHDQSIGSPGRTAKGSRNDRFIQSPESALYPRGETVGTA